MAGPRALPPDPFSVIEDEVYRALGEWRDPTVVWLGRALFAGSMVAAGVFGAGVVWLVLRVTGWLEP